MKRGRAIGVTVAVGMLLLAMKTEAGEGVNGYLEGSTRKLGRGACNVVTAPLELIRAPYLVTQQEGSMAGATVGVIQGVGAVIIRELAGVVEIATFFLPFPNGFHPLIKPEFIYAHGDWVP
ncbi:MAG: exosortase system-associated protein, TIGR04073 family [Candidatus Omnitrophica bacterium]|nr:exosortase system-associated protein, TIGR04073 family [Candidatus Omnitrophota bacterium]